MMDSALDEYKQTEKFTTARVSVVAKNDHSALGHFGLAITIFTVLAIGVFLCIHCLRSKLHARRYHTSLPNVNPRVAYKAPPINRRW